MYTRLRLWVRRVLRGIDHLIEERARLPLRRRVIVVICSVPITILMFLFVDHGSFVATIIAYFLLLLSLAHERAADLGSASRLKETLIVFGEKVDAHHTYAHYKLVYDVDARELDPWFRVFSIRPAAGAAVVHVKRFFVGATQAIGKRIWTFGDLAVRAETAEGEVYVLDTGYDADSGGWSGDLLFEKPIISHNSKPREVTLRGCWPGLWDDLRRTGKDSGAFRLDVDADVLVISVLFPRAWGNRRLAIAPVEFPDNVTESKKPTRRTSKAGKPQATWKIIGAKAGTYRYEVVAETVSHGAPIQA